MSGFANKSLDPAIVRRAKRGDRKAHEVIFRALSGPVYTLARRMTSSASTADDVLQETFVEVLRKIDQYREEASLATWVRHIAVSKSLMHMRSAWERRSESVESFSFESEPGFDRLTHTAPESARVIAAHDMEQAFTHLPEVSRAVVWLHDVEGYTHREIGELMGRSTSFSKSQLARAHLRLRELLNDDDGRLGAVSGSVN